jgi:hypothetical protein
MKKPGARAGLIRFSELKRERTQALIALMRCARRDTFREAVFL